ncbi:MAG TPA: DUF427 domain-containing protein [Burkholderiaceae bacterium]|nr:DUF427 domain-containing protein [Burkholderiaceae bacterium]
MSVNSGPGYRKHPDHRIATTRSGEHVRVTFNGEVIADTRNAIRLEESDYPDVYYVPRKDANMERLIPTAHRTYCPFKGNASYFTLSSGGRTADNAVWSYETPYDEVGVIKDCLAFYPNKVDSITVTQEVTADPTSAKEH